MFSFVTPKIFLKRIWRPVCSKDGETFGNQCSLECKGAEKKCDGECPCKYSEPGPKPYSDTTIPSCDCPL